MYTQVFHVSFLQCTQAYNLKALVILSDIKSSEPTWQKTYYVVIT
jgi:hypothetical protein